MNTRRNLLIVAIAMLSSAVGGIVGYRIATANAESRDFQRLDSARALRGTDFQNRLVLIRLLRERNASAGEVSAVELSALSLLQTIELDSAPEGSASQFVLSKVAGTLAAYCRDFPLSELDPSKRSEVAHLLSIYSPSAKK